MKKIVTVLFLLFLTTQGFSYYMTARGLTDPGEQWTCFRTTGFVTESESFYGFTRHTVECSYKIYDCSDYRNPSNQPFEIIWVLRMPVDAVITEAYLRSDGVWIKADPEDVLDAEKAYEDEDYKKPRFLIREMVSRDYNGNQRKTHQMNFGPVYYPNSFAVKFTFITKNKIDIHAMRETILLNQFLIDDDSNIQFTVKFRDYDHPQNKPFIVSGYQNDMMNFTLDNGWWKMVVPFKNQNQYRYYSDIELKWDRPFTTEPELRLFDGKDNKFYHILMLPPVTPEDRQTKSVLLLYDLGSKVPSRHSRYDIIEKYRRMTKLTLAPTDSINMIFFDGFAPAVFTPAFVPATQANIDAVFDKLKSMMSVQISGLPQLLRATKDYFNDSGSGGELWVLSNAQKHSNPPSVANEIMQLSYYQLDVPVTFNIFDCREYDDWYTRITINGQTYYGNEYLYQNLARLSGGGLLTAFRIPTLDLELEIAEVFAPAADLVKVEMMPTGGYFFTKYDLNDGRTHYPVTFPVQELGRYEGGLPMETVFYGQVDGQTLRKDISVADTIDSKNNSKIEQLWHVKYIEDLLKQPQSFVTIEKIARLSKENHILTPYCGFVIPSPSGYKGFKRLVEVDTTDFQQEEPPADVILPDDFTFTAFPNPFNARTTLQIELPPADHVRPAEIRIIDVLGRIVREINLDVSSDQHLLKIFWDGTNDQNIQVSTGLYFVQCVIGNFNQTLKITLLK
ncbi:T9SS type A sorting domain-containing protein [candidate division KSB1 bacterium]|nr:T9SS type A sorting domain-containing protein [candidate division KSB1 bacterium]